MTVDSTLESLFFTVDAIADGVFAAIAKPGTGAMANAGIIDLGDQTLIFDTMYTPSAGKALSEAAVQIFQRPVSIVINSHFHMDHVGGNQSCENQIPLHADSRSTIPAAITKYSHRKKPPGTFPQAAFPFHTFTQPQACDPDGSCKSVRLDATTSLYGCAQDHPRSMRPLYTLFQSLPLPVL